MRPLGWKAEGGARRPLQSLFIGLTFFILMLPPSLAFHRLPSMPQVWRARDRVAPAALGVLSDETEGGLSSYQGQKRRVHTSVPRGNNNTRGKTRNHTRKRTNTKHHTKDEFDENFRKAIAVEKKLSNLLFVLRRDKSSSAVDTCAVPLTRQCNQVCKTFGDRGDLLRALKVYKLMRGVHTVCISNGIDGFPIPAPNLVTYSTLMSRAVNLQKPLVSFRLWHLMLSSNDEDVQVDTKAANILMNAFAKYSDLRGARTLFKEMLDSCLPTATPSTAYSLLPRGTINCIPNTVTYNTFIDALHRCGELGEALQVLELMKSNRVRRDTMTYTTLISAVGLSQSIDSDQAYGANDPDVAFQLFDSMKKEERLRPNGKTYCALINVCSRVRRPDLALKVLRMMINESPSYIEEENGGDFVGAWTATINACGKNGRVDTALTLFRNMGNNFKVKPNEVTCSCLFDILLRENRVGETLDILHYMKKEKLQPTEFMYTSLLRVAGKLMRKEQDGNVDESVTSLDIYAAMMKSMAPQAGVKSGLADENLMRVFLIFSEIKSPDIVCYTTLLAACARVGEVEKSLEILQRVKEDEDLGVTIKMYTELMRCAIVAKRKDLARFVVQDMKSEGIAPGEKFLALLNKSRDL